MAAVDYFLKINGIPGESQDSKHKGEIQLESWSWGATNKGTFASGTGGGGAGKVAMQDFSIIKQIDKSSPKLFLACASGQHIPDALFTARKAGKDQQEYLKIKFTDLLVSSYQTGGTADQVTPTETFSLNFSKIEVQYAPQKSDGTLDAPIVHNYDVKANKGG
jgi:type VI secretion system secreted protein Hcp